MSRHRRSFRHRRGRGGKHVHRINRLLPGRGGFRL